MITQRVLKACQSPKRCRGNGINDLNLDVESLESRQMLAGNVTAVISGQNLVLTGDMDHNNIVISQSGSEISIRGNETTISFGGDSFNEVTLDLGDRGLNNLRLNMSGGNNTVSINDVDMQKNLRIISGDGNDALYLNALTVGGNVIGKTGDGDDFFSVEESDIEKNIRVNLGDGASMSDQERGSGGGDSFLLVDTYVTGDVEVDQEDGQGRVELTYSTVQGDVEAKTKENSDHFLLRYSTVGGDVNADLGKAENEYYGPGDRAAFYGSSVYGSLNIVQSDGSGRVDVDYTRISGDVTIETGRGLDVVGNDSYRGRDGYGYGYGYGALSVGGNVTIDLGSSESAIDVARLSGFEVEGDLAVSQSSGDSLMLLSDDSYYYYDGYYCPNGDLNVGGNLSISTGTGNDQVLGGAKYGGFSGGTVTVNGDATINLGSSDSDSEDGPFDADFLSLAATTISGDLSVRQTVDSAYVAIGDFGFGGVNVEGNASVRLGAGSDTMSTEFKYGGDRSVDGDASALVVGGNATINLGAANAGGEDNLRLSSANVDGNLSIIQSSSAANIELSNSSTYFSTASGGGGGAVVVGNNLDILTGGGSDRVVAESNYYFGYYGPSADYSVIVGGNATINLGAAESSQSEESLLGYGGDYTSLFMMDVNGDLAVRQAANVGNVYLDTVSVSGQTEIETGTGDDYVDLYHDDYGYSSRLGFSGLTIAADLGAGDDSFYAYGVSLADSNIDLGLGDDWATFGNVEASGNFAVDMGGGLDQLEVNFSTFYSSVVFDGGTGFDSAVLSDVAFLGGDPSILAMEDFDPGEDF